MPSISKFSVTINEELVLHVSSAKDAARSLGGPHQHPSFKLMSLANGEVVAEGMIYERTVQKLVSLLEGVR